MELDSFSLAYIGNTSHSQRVSDLELTLFFGRADHESKPKLSGNQAWLAGISPVNIEKK